MGIATGLRISSVNGTAFLDNCPADVLAAVGIGAQIKIYDSSSRYLQGVIDAVGSSEGLTEKISDNGFDVDGSWLKEAGWTVSGSKGNATSISSTMWVYQDIVTKPIGALYKGVVTIDSITTTGNLTLRIGNNMASQITGLSFVNTGTKTGYLTWIQTEHGYIGVSALRVTSAVVDDLHISQVTAPSSSGVIIKDLSGNQNFISKDASFTYNASGYTYEIIQGGGCLVGSSALVGGHILVGHGSLIN